jgi:hypothetical protein
MKMAWCGACLINGVVKLHALAFHALYLVKTINIDRSDVTLLVFKVRAGPRFFLSKKT